MTKAITTGKSVVKTVRISAGIKYDYSDFAYTAEWVEREVTFNAWLFVGIRIQGYIKQYSL